MLEHIDSCSSTGGRERERERGGKLEVAEQMSRKKTSSCAGHHLLKEHPVTDTTAAAADHHLKHFSPHKDN